MRRFWAALGSLLFFAIAPGTLLGLIPWSITGWRLRPAFWGIDAFRLGGAALLLAVEPDVGTCLHLACKNGSLPIVRELLQAAGDGGALLQPVGKGRWTPLYVASIFGHAEVVRLLLEAPGGREVVNAPAECGSTPLDAACVLGHARTARLLAAAGGIRAKPDARAPGRA